MPQQYRAAPNHYYKLRPYATTVDAWSSGYRWDSTGIFDFYDWQNNAYKCCNGHYNNYHWSIYCDNGNGGHGLVGCTTTAMPAGYQTPFGGAPSGGSGYYNFHDYSSKQANGDYLFYFR